MRPILAASFAMLLALAGASASAQQWGSVFKGGPAELFDDDDWRLFQGAAREVLSRSTDQETLGWQNPKTGHRGDVKVLRSFESRGRRCKEMEIRNEAQGRKGDERLNVCNVGGEWRLVGDSQL